MEGATYYRHLCVVALIVSAAAGCSFSRSSTVWRPPVIAAPEANSPDAAEQYFAAAVRSQQDGDPACVDYYYQSAAYAWRGVDRGVAVGQPVPPRTTELYNSALAQLLITAQEFGRWNPHSGITIVTAAGPMVAPARFEGFLWSPGAFESLAPCGQYEDPNLLHQHRSPGLGVTLVAQRQGSDPEPFTRRDGVFAATALLRPCEGGASFQLDFFDPLRVSTTYVAGRQVAIARDISAPFAYAGRVVNRQWLDEFIRPDAASARDGLFMIEPFQPDKIPVVLVHGLLSDPETWVTMTNELRAQPGLNDRFQWWGFHYATGEPFLASAAALRRQLTQLRRVYDPARRDPALSQMVIVGHSMGGLVAKLQVTSSGELLWDSFATRPLAGVRMPPEGRQLVHEAFFFRPSPDITRIVYIATPHLGSTWARRPVGRLASAMVKPSEQRHAQFEQLVRDNPGLLRDDSTGRLPTSIDLLEPTNPLLVATSQLPISSRVTSHSIVGLGRTTWTGEPSDGVVPASSARLYGVATERDVDTVHTRVQKDPVSVTEVERILRIHLTENARLTTQGAGRPGWK
ncbi:Alpha/beta hydrolase family protein [Pirellulimonas nuda]|uniref:Alpha/beta hydrolase family protein n=1 Tax=Pirellulimonas nuda TaxID=2528009 RepID=A0A518D9Y5_9BACT|nr:alpha/beta fold hydrolase [Pirellulimonas nuda]QDU88248.1 Alpha/beta hydrolase family protein [Pirellulimonas nuda]